MIKKKFSQSLRIRVMALMGGLFFALFILIVTSILLFVYTTEQENWRARQTEAAQNAARAVENYLFQNENILYWLDHIEYDAIKIRPALLKEVIQDYPSFLEILFVDKSGKPHYGASQGEPTLANQFTILQSEWFQSSLAGERVYTRVQTSPQNQSYTIFAMPSEHGGVLAAQIQMDALWATVAQIRFGKSGSIYIVNQGGQVIAHPDKQVVLSNLNIGDTKQFRDILQAHGQEWIGITVNFDGIRVVSVSAPIENTDWIVISELPIKEAFAATYRATIIIPIVILILMSITVLTFRNIFLRQVLDPLQHLQHGTHEISVGNLSYRLKIPREDELGEVTAGFNSMAIDLEKQRNDLKTYAENLESRVHDRTVEITAANEQLRQDVHEKETLLKEIHHRVKNNLQVISSLLNLQASQIQDNKTLQALRDSQVRVRSMALIHEKLYRSKSLEKIDFGEYVQSLTNDLFRSYQRKTGIINLQIHVDEIFLPLDQAIPCGLILNELVTNALKYAFPDGRNGTICVELLKESENMISLRVADDGIGLPNDLDIRTTKSLGWQLVNNLIQQLAGTLIIENAQGTTCNITFSIKAESL